MKCASVNISFAAQQMRFDGSFHLSDGLEVRRMIKNSPYGLSTIRDITKDIYCPGIFRRNYTKSGYAFLGGGDIQKADYDSGKYLKKIRTPNWEILEVKKGWTLVTCGGTIGDTVFTNNLLAKCWVSQHVMRVIPNDSIKEGMLYAYLATKYGKLLLTTGTYGSVIPTISSENIAVLPIPNFPDSFQKEVDDLIQQSATLREQATAKLDEAKKTFENVIGVSNTDYGAYKNEGIAIQSIAGKFKRMDSQYQIGHKSIVKEKRNLTTTKINDVAKDIFTGNRGKRNYVENDGIYFLSSSEMMLANPKRFCKKISRRTPNLNDLLVKKGNILISRSGTVGNTILVSDDLNGCAVSEHAMRLVIDEEKIAPEYVFAYFCTKQGKDSLAILPYGSVIVTLGEEFLGDVDLPLLPIETQDRITALVKEYSKMTDMAIEKENKAITMVEEEIEKWQSPTA